jgi:hypothetical protein
MYTYSKYLRFASAFVDAMSRQSIELVTWTDEECNWTVIFGDGSVE